MQRLATFAYSRVLSNQAVREHLTNETTQAAFWKLDDATRRMIWGAPLNLGSESLVETYDQWERALDEMAGPT
jgi:hypothetical protein